MSENREQAATSSTEALGARIWHQKHAFVDLSCLVWTVRAGGGGAMVRGMFPRSTLGH